MNACTRRIGLGLLAVTMTVAAGGWYAVTTSSYELQPQTSITVQGTSTVHDFECKVGLVSGVIEIPASPAGEVAQVLDDLRTVSVNVPVDKIDCGNGTMDKKMKAALNASKAPIIKYTLEQTTVTGAADADGFYPMNTTGRLMLAGQERPVRMAVNGKQLPDGRFLFSGSTTIKMSDWGISPPTAMLGAMKTGNEVTVVFDAIAAN